MTGPARRFATYEDVLDAPENKVAEVLAGVLHLNPLDAIELDLAVLWAGVQL